VNRLDRLRAWWRVNRAPFWVGFESVFDWDGTGTYERMLKVLDAQPPPDDGAGAPGRR
jgi:hypothetical protein